MTKKSDTSRFTSVNGAEIKKKDGSVWKFQGDKLVQIKAARKK